MMIQERLQKIAVFLKKYEHLHKREFIKQYPAPYPQEIQPWIHELKSFSLDKLADLESDPHESKVSNSSFKTFLQNIRKLSELPRTSIPETQLPSNILRQLTPKKKHEVQMLKTLVEQDKSIETILDIGGGIGHLSSALINDSKRSSYCIDANEALQKAGKEKVQNWLNNRKDAITFIPHFFDKGSVQKLALTDIENNSLILGLHSCGDLSGHIVTEYKNSKITKLLNFGCCYHKLTTTYNLSTKAKEIKIDFTTNALHLASRCGKAVTLKDLEERYKFKSYRYGLHYFFYDNYGMEFMPLGNAAKADYRGSFSQYVLNNHKGSNKQNLSQYELEEFFKTVETKEKIQENFLADLIRLFLGRLIEIYIILDRALYLQEHGLTVRVSEVFDRDLSPRNILIYSTRDN